jgi:hypothetical protein
MPHRRCNFQIMGNISGDGVVAMTIDVTAILTTAWNGGNKSLLAARAADSRQSCQPACDSFTSRQWIAGRTHPLRKEEGIVPAPS